MSANPEGAPTGSASAREVALLHAGALLPAAADLPVGEPSDLVGARVYRHPALGERVVVRLTPEPLAPADDAELEVLGFGKPEVKPAVARTRRRGLGFPGWALVHDPAHARHALTVVKELKVQAKLARSKPGFAKEGFDKIAEGLSRTVPHFLPSFWEEAGRAFLESGNQTYAASAFAKAREAERVHALEVDPAGRDRAFLEFALAGAVSGKALSEYAQELSAAEDHADAYARFRELCVRRTLGGMPPWAAMAKDLRRLQKLAGADQDREDDRILRELLDSPSLIHAASEFWTAYGPALAQLARGSPKVRGELFRMLPEPAGDRQRFVAQWLELLEQGGALAGVLEARDRIAPEESPADGAAGWLSRLLRHCQGRFEVPDAVFALVRRMAARLRSDAQPVSVSGRWGVDDLDVLDLLCELAVPVADPPERVVFHLDQWIKKSPGSTERPRDPVHAVGDARYRPFIERAVGAAMCTPGFEAASRAMKGLAEARRGWILGQVGQLASGALPAFKESLEAMSRALSPSTFAALPEAWKALSEVDVARSLSHTLRNGIVDELGWPELEAAEGELRAASGGSSAVFGAFPYAILQSGLRVIVVGAQGKVLEHELRLPKGARLQNLDLTYVQGQLLVICWVPTEGHRAYWSARPDELFEASPAHSWGMEARVEVELPDGALVRGARALHAGDVPAAPALVFFDGATFWSHRQDALHELDPKTGAVGRKSLPRFLEEYVQEGKSLVLPMCSLHSLPAPLRDRTPLGSRDGLAGLRVRRAADGSLECEGIDGRSARFANHTVLGLVRLPGLDEPLAVASSHQALTLVAPGGQVQAQLAIGRARQSHAAGTPVVLPAPFWHLLRVRDEAASHALRSFAPRDARALVAAVHADKAAGKAELPKGREILSELLPNLRDPGLCAGVLGLAAEAERLEAQLEQQRSGWNPSTASAAPAPPLRDALIERGLKPLVNRSGHPTEGLLSAEIAAVGGFMQPAEAGKKSLLQRAAGALGLETRPGEQIQKSPILGGFRWDQLIGSTGAVAFVASSPLTAPEVRDALVEFLELWASTPFVGAGRFRRCLLALPHESVHAPVANAQRGLLVARGDHRWFVRPKESYGGERNYAAIEMAADARFELLPGSAIAEEEAVDDRPWSLERLRAFLEVLSQKGPRPVTAEVIAELSRRTGLARPQAALLFGALADLDKWENDFLGKERREALALKAVEARVAREELRSVAPGVRREVLSAAAAADAVDALWNPLGSGPDDEKSPVARMAVAWNRRVGQRVAVDEGLLVRCARELPRGVVEPPTFLAALARCAEAPEWTLDGAWALGENGVECAGPRKDEGPRVFSGDILDATALYLPFLFDALRVGDPLRAQLPALLRLSRERLAHPGLLVDAGSGYFEEKSPEREALFDAIGSEPYPPGADRNSGRDGGLVLVKAGRWSVVLAFRPARLTSPTAPSVKLIEGSASFAATRALSSEAFARMAARTSETPVPKDGYEANPLLSVPALVAEVQAARELSEDAAMLYLQILSHHAPTSRAVLTWNGWTSARAKKAAKELTGRGLLLEAKRARAGRDLFLPGGWEELKAPELPIETWKLPLYEAERSAAGIKRPLGVLLPLRPVHEIFEAAWQRVKAGDQPGYEEIP